MKALVQLILNATAAGKDMLLAANAAAQKVLLSLGNVDNTSDANKPVSTAQQTALDAKLAIAGGTLTGDLKFTDATYDIGKSGVTRPRDGFFSRNVAIGGTLGVTGATTCAALTASGNVAVSSIGAGTSSYRVSIGTYGTISETGGGLGYITGNSVAAHTTNNTVVKTSGDVGHFMRMRYDQGISFHTGITGSVGVTSADDGNQRLIIDGNGLATFSNPVIVGVYTFATVPTASLNTGGEIRISDRAQRRAYSDGTHWRFIADDVIIS